MADMKPALTPEEWSIRTRPQGERGQITWWQRCVQVVDPETGDIADATDRHALAALALHGQPFGFTWEDVWEIRCVAHDIECQGGYHVAVILRQIADRIAALLSPHEGPENP